MRLFFNVAAFLVTCLAVPFQLVCLGTGYVYIGLDNLATWLEVQ